MAYAASVMLSLKPKLSTDWPVKAFTGPSHEKKKGQKEKWNTQSPCLMPGKLCLLDLISFKLLCQTSNFSFVFCLVVLAINCGPYNSSAITNLRSFRLVKLLLVKQEKMRTPELTLCFKHELEFDRKQVTYLMHLEYTELSNMVPRNTREN